MSAMREWLDRGWGFRPVNERRTPPGHQMQPSPPSPAVPHSRSLGSILPVIRKNTG